MRSQGRKGIEISGPKWNRGGRAYTVLLMSTATATEPIAPIAHVPGWRRTILKGVLVIAVMLAVARLAAPYAVRHAINRRLAKIPDYSGHVQDVTLHIWRGAYGMSGLRIVKSNGSVSEPFFDAGHIEFSIAWGEIFHGRLVSEIYARDVQLNFRRGPTDANSQLTADKRWQDVIDDLFPIDITYLDVRGGTLSFVDATQNPRVDISIHNLNIIATGLQNRSTAKEGPMPAKIEVSGTSIGEGRLRLFAKLEPLADTPHFELAMEMNKMALPALNDFLMAYANVNVSEGQFDVVAQMAMRDGHYEGYVKPFVSHLKFADLKPGDDTIGRRIWGALLSAFAELAKNRESHQVATRIPFSGDVKNLDIHTWKTIENALHHGLIRALPKGFEGTTNPDGLPPKTQVDPNRPSDK